MTGTANPTNENQPKKDKYFANHFYQKFKGLFRDDKTAEGGGQSLSRQAECGGGHRHFAINGRKGIAFCLLFPEEQLSLFPKVVAWFALKQFRMLGWTLIFLIVALIAGVLGFTGIAGAAVGIARILFAIFLILFLASLVFRLING